MARESAIVRAILSYLNNLPECIAYKTKGGATSSGLPDIMGCYKGRALCLEVKTADHGNTVTEKQEQTLEKWYAAGAIVGVVYSTVAVQEGLAQFDIQKGPCGEYLNTVIPGAWSWMRWRA